MVGYESVRKWAQIVTILLGITILSEVIEVAFMVSQHALLDRAAEGLVDEIEASTSDSRIQVLAGIQLVLLLASAAAFVTWMSAAHRNLRVFGIPSNFSPAQVGWAFFIPFVNLVRPYRIIKLIWEGSTPVDERLIGRSSQIVSFWWGAYIVAGLIGRAAGSMAKSEDIPALKTMTVTSILGTLIRIVAAVLAIIVVRALTERQESCASGQVADEFD